MGGRERPLERRRRDMSFFPRSQPRPKQLDMLKRRSVKAQHMMLSVSDFFFVGGEKRRPLRENR